MHSVYVIPVVTVVTFDALLAMPNCATADTAGVLWLTWTRGGLFITTGD